MSELDSFAQGALDELRADPGLTVDEVTTRMGTSRPASAGGALERLQAAKLAREDGAGRWWPVT